jgi:hypothetical protein
LQADISKNTKDGSTNLANVVHATLPGAAASPAIHGRALAGKIVHWTIFFFLLALGDF